MLSKPQAFQRGSAQIQHTHINTTTYKYNTHTQPKIGRTSPKHHEIEEIE